MHTLKVLIFINKTKSFKVFLLEKYLSAKIKQKKTFKIEKTIKLLTRA